jgi:thiol-disulfide isomerase/thioredoxin
MNTATFFLSLAPEPLYKLLRKTLVVILALCVPLMAHATGVPYTQAEFDARLDAGSPTLVFVHAPWCSICKAQTKILDELLPQPEFSRIKVLRVDFDSQKAIVKSFKTSYQSTLIVYKDGKEVGRAVAETNKDNIAALLRKAL